MVAMRVTVTGTRELRAALRRANPEENNRIMQNGMKSAALEIQKNAALKQIKRGGGGKRNAAPPVPGRLTSRAGTLRDSIRVNHGPLPFAIEIGTDLTYGVVHEFGSKTHPPRPFLKPALSAIAPRFGEIFVREWKKEARL